MELPRAHFKPNFENLKKSLLKKVFMFSGNRVIFQEIELFSSNIKKFLIFSQKKAFLIFRQMEPSYFSENGNPEKILYISGNRTFLYFRKRNFLIFRIGIFRTLAYLELEAYSEPQHIQNQNIFRTLVYSGREVYSEQCQTSTMERFAKIAT